MARTKTEHTPPVVAPELTSQFQQDVRDAQREDAAAADGALALAVQLAYDGPLTIGTLEDEIRFYQRRSVEALLECGKRLLILKELTPHGEFISRCELLGFAERTARRFMQAAAKTSKSANLAVLSTQVKSASAFLELVTHDDDALENLQDIDAIDRMSASELRAALRGAQADRQATQEVMDKKNARIDKLEREKALISKLPADDALLKLQHEATAIMNDALGAVRGGMRQALVALGNEQGSNQVFMAGLVGQIVAECAALREEFGLPDVSNAADLQLAAETAEWAG